MRDARTSHAFPKSTNLTAVLRTSYFCRIGEPPRALHNSTKSTRPGKSNSSFFYFAVWSGGALTNLCKCTSIDRRAETDIRYRVRLGAKASV